MTVTVSKAMKKQVSHLDPNSPLQEYTKKKIISKLLIALTIYGLLYLLYIIDFNMNDNYDPYNSESIVINVAIVLFLIGYSVAWKNEFVAGIIFIFWWFVMWYLSLFIAGHDRGGGVGLGLPLLILGILFIISGYRKKGRAISSPDTKHESKTYVSE